MRLLRIILSAVLAAVISFSAVKPVGAVGKKTTGRIFVLMVWDGLRPDSVTSSRAPNLYRMRREGVHFIRHYSVFPTLTMVNAAALATGAAPGANGILGNTMYLGSALKDFGAKTDDPDLKGLTRSVVKLESSRRLAMLNSSKAFAGRFVALDTVGQEVLREGGYLAVLGKRGPTYLFDNRLATVEGGRDSLNRAHKNYLFVADDMAAPEALSEALLRPLKGKIKSLGGVIERDAYFTRLAVQRALPQAKEASDRGRPALIVLWQRNPDLTQHAAGLGTRESLAALKATDANLGTIRAAISRLGIRKRTDLMVVADHGFSTIRVRIDLASLLVSMGLKDSKTSTDVVVAPNGGSDLVYLSRTKFPTVEKRRAILQKIVNFAAAQEWCGPMFSLRSAPRVKRRRYRPYLGWIKGTFSQTALGLFNQSRSPDLIIAFQESSTRSNYSFTGPKKPAFTLSGDGQRTVPNHSAKLLYRVRGMIFADTGPGDFFTTGMGMHGGAGTRCLHAFMAAVGPGFRRKALDYYPNSSIDVAPTISHLLGLAPNIGPAGLRPSGRVIVEALSGRRRSPGRIRTRTWTSRLVLQGVRVITRLKTRRVGKHTYLYDSSIVRQPLGSSP